MDPLASFFFHIHVTRTPPPSVPGMGLEVVGKCGKKGIRHVLQRKQQACVHQRKQQACCCELEVL